jgi:hypothetical protein
VYSLLPGLYFDILAIARTSRLLAIVRDFRLSKEICEFWFHVVKNRGNWVTQIELPLKLNNTEVGIKLFPEHLLAPHSSQNANLIFQAFSSVPRNDLTLKE